MHYKLLVAEDISEFEDEVEMALGSGFMLFGYPFFANGKYHQAVVKSNNRESN